jgi:hypothetical protein
MNGVRHAGRFVLAEQSTPCRQQSRALCALIHTLCCMQNVSMSLAGSCSNHLVAHSTLFRSCTSQRA